MRPREASAMRKERRWLGPMQTNMEGRFHRRVWTGHFIFRLCEYVNLIRIKADSINISYRISVRQFA